ncbi:uncharacterized protein LOC115301948 [Suricata suricatta]|uniref:uncharacterized protein LOC115301948 n=1 Tax=Suricata suricatta TaxID=37032 RepID=UPI001155A85A|nr:uncharacterized protein LOC115301948 [Suricata suricatta]
MLLVIAISALMAEGGRASAWPLGRPRQGSTPEPTIALRELKAWFLQASTEEEEAQGPEAGKAGGLWRLRSCWCLASTGVIKVLNTRKRKKRSKVTMWHSLCKVSQLMALSSSRLIRRQHRVHSRVPVRQRSYGQHAGGVTKSTPTHSLRGPRGTQRAWEITEAERRGGIRPGPPSRPAEPSLGTAFLASPQSRICGCPSAPEPHLPRAPG